MDQAHDGPGLLIVADIDFLIQFIQFILSAPYLRVFELNKSILRNELPRPKVTSSDDLDTGVSRIHACLWQMCQQDLH